MARRKSWSRPRHKIIQKLVRWPFKVFLRSHLNYHAEKVEVPDGPCLILSNHQTTWDPFLVGLSFKVPVYYVSSDDLLSKGFTGPLLKWAVNPIPKTKSISDLRSVHIIMNVIKEGQKVCLFPEGNRTYDGELCTIDKSIAKLAKLLDCPLVLYNIKGGFGGEPRFARKMRRGIVRGYAQRIMSPDEVKSMSNDDLYDLIIKSLTVNETKSVEIPFRSNRSAEYLDRVLYKCPDCGKLQTIYSKGDEVFCVSCGYRLKYGADLKFEKLSGRTDFLTVHDWYKWQVDYIRHINLDELEGHIFADLNVILYHVLKMKRRVKLVKRGKVTIDKNELKVTDRRHIVSIPLEDIRSGCVVGKHKANFFIDDYIYQIKGDARFNALKYVQFFYHVYNAKKGTSGDSEFLGI